jgi:6-phosphofructokinase 1
MKQPSSRNTKAKTEAKPSMPASSCSEAEPVPASSIPTSIKCLGPAKIPSPLYRDNNDREIFLFVRDDERILINIDVKSVKEVIRSGECPPSFEKAGPRAEIFFNPAMLRCAIVTCGGLCPGLNDIIRSIVLELHYRYQVPTIYGVKFGLAGFIPQYRHPLVNLTPEKVRDIHAMGGTILGSSRGAQDVSEIVDCLERQNIGLLFIIGGEGTINAASKICDEIDRRRVKIGVVAIPKTIDNDIFLVDRSFGFDTAVEMATSAIRSAHTEAEGYPNGVGLVKLMGRNAGFIAATAVLAQQDVNFALIPEADFDLHGENGLLAALERRLANRGHAVIVVAEGAGQNFFPDTPENRDASGNKKLQDIGALIKNEIASYFQKKNIPINLKYVDPSYMIRSLPANSNDTVFCSALARNAVHAGMAGKTRLLAGYWKGEFVHVPLDATAGKHKQINTSGGLWQAVLEATGQGSLKN